MLDMLILLSASQQVRKLKKTNSSQTPRRCRRDASEDYFGHVGALRCMVEGGGDVAFVRHTAPHEVSGGRRREWWARDLLTDDLQLLCVDGQWTIFLQ